MKKQYLAILNAVLVDGGKDDIIAAELVENEHEGELWFGMIKPDDGTQVDYTLWSLVEILNRPPRYNFKTEQPTPAEDRYGRDVKPETCGYPEYRVNVGCVGCPYDCSMKIKSLAQYLAEYIGHKFIDTMVIGQVWRELLKQALDAYESTENVKIRIERV